MCRQHYHQLYNYKRVVVRLGKRNGNVGSSFGLQKRAIGVEEASLGVAVLT